MTDPREYPHDYPNTDDDGLCLDCGEATCPQSVPVALCSPEMLRARSEDFQAEVNRAAYALAMNALNLPEGDNTGIFIDSDGNATLETVPDGPSGPPEPPKRETDPYPACQAKYRAECRKAGYCKAPYCCMD